MLRLDYSKVMSTYVTAPHFGSPATHSVAQDVLLQQLFEAFYFHENWSKIHLLIYSKTTILVVLAPTHWLDDGQHERTNT